MANVNVNEADLNIVVRQNYRYLDVEQGARTEALFVANQVVHPGTVLFGGRARTDIDNLIEVAEYILSGLDYEDESEPEDAVIVDEVQDIPEDVLDGLSLVGSRVRVDWPYSSLNGREGTITDRIGGHMYEVTLSVDEGSVPEILAVASNNLIMLDDSDTKAEAPQQHGPRAIKDNPQA